VCVLCVCVFSCSNLLHPPLQPSSQPYMDIVNTDQPKLLAWKASRAPFTS